MQKYVWTATVTKPGHRAGHGNGTVEARNLAHAEELIRDFVVQEGGITAFAKDIKIIPMK